MGMEMDMDVEMDMGDMASSCGVGPGILVFYVLDCRNFALFHSSSISDLPYVYPRVFPPCSYIYLSLFSLLDLVHPYHFRATHPSSLSCSALFEGENYPLSLNCQLLYFHVSYCCDLETCFLLEASLVLADWHLVFSQIPSPPLSPSSSPGWHPPCLASSPLPSRCCSDMSYSWSCSGP